jgi:hypothetical protein
MTRKQPTRGLTLAEAIIAIFILAFGFIVMARLFHAALHYEANSDAQQTAVVLANSRMDEIRGWNWQAHYPGSGIPFSDWTGVPSAATETNFEEYTVKVTANPQTMYSPCSQFELVYPLARQRRMTKSSMWVMVEVSWNSGRGSYTLESLVSAPPALLPVPGLTASIPTTTPLAANMKEHILPQIHGSDGNLVPDVFFTWTFDSGSPSNHDDGIGTVTGSRDGQDVYLNNYMTDANGIPIGVGNGKCQIDSQCRARGVTIGTTSSTITLDP